MPKRRDRRPRRERARRPPHLAERGIEALQRGRAALADHQIQPGPGEIFDLRRAAEAACRRRLPVQLATRGGRVGPCLRRQRPQPGRRRRGRCAPSTTPASAVPRCPRQQLPGPPQRSDAPAARWRTGCCPARCDRRAGGRGAAPRRPPSAIRRARQGPRRSSGHAPQAGGCARGRRPLHRHAPPVPAAACPESG